jgi:glycerate kinase
MNSQTNPIILTTLIDSFKHSFSSKSASETAITAFTAGKTEPLSNSEKISIKVNSFTISDGGEGFIDAISAPLELNPIAHIISGPLNTPQEAFYLFDPDQDLVVLESAQGVGIQNVPQDRRNPRVVSSYGVGEQLGFVLEKYLEEGFEKKGKKFKIILGLGGTASVDCGLGLLFGLLGNGIECRKQSEGDVLTNGGYDVCLGEIDQIDIKLNKKTIKILQKLSKTQIILASDVTNPLLGEHGATYVFGPQKGLKMDELTDWEAGMVKFSTILQQRTHSPVDLAMQPGCGAAGGIGFALNCLMNLSRAVIGGDGGNDGIVENNDVFFENRVIMQPGFELLCEYSPIQATAKKYATFSLNNSLQVLDNEGCGNKIMTIPMNQFIITGEGCLDSQSFDGKAVERICQTISKFQIDKNDMTGLEEKNGKKLIDFPIGVNIPVIVLCGYTTLAFENPTLSNFPQIASNPPQNVDLIDKNESQIMMDKCGEMNIVKIININDEKFHFCPEGVNKNGFLKSNIQNLQGLDLKLSLGHFNCQLVLCFLAKLLQNVYDESIDKDNNGIMIKFIEKLRDIK